MDRKAIYKKPLYEIRKIDNLKDMLEQSAEIYADKPAFLVKDKAIDKYMPISYKKFKEDVDSIGTALMSFGLSGKRIVLIGENRYEWAVSYLAVVNGTGIIVPIDKELPENEIESLITRSEAVAIIFSGKHLNEMQEISLRNKNVKIMVNMDSQEDIDGVLSFKKILAEGKKLVDEGEDSFIKAKIDNEAMNMLLFTSGTTAQSKAVMLSHKNISMNLMDMCSLLKIVPTDVVLSILPIHHTYECTCGFLCQIYRGSTIAFCEGLRHIVKNLKEAEVTVMLSVPLILETIYKKMWEGAAKKLGGEGKLKFIIGVSNLLRSIGIDLRKVIFKQIHETVGGKIRLFICGAAGINPKVAKGYRDFGIPSVQGYGLTECSPILALNRDVLFKDDAGGVPLVNVEIRIDQPSESGEGEIVAKGPNVMLGYYNNKEATDEVLKDGWFYTGDLGFIDKDGFIHITGRKKDVIVTKNGKNIYPEEMEKVVNECKFVKESMIYGKTMPDDDVQICAIIVIDKEVFTEEFKCEISDAQIQDIMEKEIRSINSKMPLYRHIRDFVIREEELIKTTTKKIKRHLEIEKINET